MTPQGGSNPSGGRQAANEEIRQFLMVLASVERINRAVGSWGSGWASLTGGIRAEASKKKQLYEDLGQLSPTLPVHRTLCRS